MSAEGDRRAFLGLAVLALPALLLSLDVSVLYLALPNLAADLGAGPTEQLWILDVYGFLVAGFLVTMGTLGDRIGRRRLLLIGAAGFAAASVFAAFSTSPAMLIVARALLGLAGATLAPSTLALVGTLFPDPGRRGRAIAIWFSCFLAGGALGPIVGGVLLEFFWWGSVFLVGVPVMVLLLVTGPRLLPEQRSGGGRLDLTSVGLSLVALLPAVWGVKALARDGVGAAPLLALALGLGAGVLFVARQRRLADPLLDLRLFRSRPLCLALGVMLGGGMAIGGLFLFVSQHLQLSAGLAPLQAGLWLLPATLAMIVGTLVGPVVLARLQPGALLATGMGVAAAGALLLTTVGEDDPLRLIAGFGLFFLGSGLPGGLGIEIVMGSVPPEKAGSASAMTETTQELGLALGLALLGSLGTAVAADAGTVAAGLTQGLHIIAVVVVVLLAGLAVASARVLPVRAGAAVGTAPV